MAWEDGPESLCIDCYNHMLSVELGIEIENKVEELTVKDSEGIKRTFLIEQKLDPMGIFIRAEENVAYGYEFAVHGELYCDQNELLQKLINKIKQGVGVSYIEERAFPNGQMYHSMVHNQLVGRVDSSGLHELPVIVVDGKPYTWEQIGKMMNTYEGFQFELKIRDLFDDID